MAYGKLAGHSPTATRPGVPVPGAGPAATPCGLWPQCFRLSHSLISNLAKETEGLLLSFADNPTLAGKGTSESVYDC